MGVALWHFLALHWSALVIGAAIIGFLICLFIYVRWVRSRRPPETTGNGIIVGPAKAFDNRSLALKIERLNAALETLKVVNQNASDDLRNVQIQTTTDTSRAFSLAIKSTAGASKDEKSKDNSKAESKTSAAAAPEGVKADAQTSVGLAASDILNDQINLASQIFNLQTLYERSLSDRMLDGKSRLQAVLGFQVSITPPLGYENCVAVIEVAVRSKEKVTKPVSLVALMPQEKTYNAESISNSERSIEGSAVVRVVSMGYTETGKSQQLFIHRDADTIAFERNPRSQPGLFDAEATVFGWEFRPVLGRDAVSPGTRQMLAVIALPEVDSDQLQAFDLEIKTRSYWRRYNRKKQTTGPNWNWLPWRVDRSGTTDSHVQSLQIPNTASIQKALAPEVSDIRWVNSGRGRATVIVKGRNFFSGTKVVIDGKVHREEDGTLTLKSDQALEFETSLDSLVTGDAVLSGRFGPSFQLKVPEEKRPFESLSISRASIEPSRYSKSFRISVDVKGLDSDGNPLDLTIATINKDWPEPVLFIGTEPVALPYDYYDVDPPTATTPTIAPAAEPALASGADNVPPSEPAAKYIRIEAWISQAMLAKNPSVSFRVPFCGLDYQTSEPLSFSEPTVTRIGGNSKTTTFRIYYPLGLGSDFSVQLDENYTTAAPALVKTSETDCLLTLANDVVSQYENMIVRIGSGEPYVKPVPSKQAAVKPAINTSKKPPAIPRGSRGPVEWAGTGLDMISDVSLAGISQQFKSYANGTRLMVFLTAGSANSEGRLTLECTTNNGDKFDLTMFVI